MSFSRHPENKPAKTTRKRNLHSVCVLLIHIVVTLRIRIASLSMKLTYIWVKGIHKWRKYGQMITLARCSPFIRFTWHKLATSGFPGRSTSRSPKDTCCFECSTGRNTDLKGKKRGQSSHIKNVLAVHIIPAKRNEDLLKFDIFFYYILCVDISMIKPWIKMIPVKWYDIIWLSEMISYHFTGLNCPIK